MPMTFKTPWDIRTGDCLELMKAMPDGIARLGIADPPYNFGINYGTGSKADQLPDAQYYEWCEKWVAEMARLLTSDGSLWIVSPDEHIDALGMILRKHLKRRQFLKWYETFGVNCKRKFNRTTRFVAHCVKDGSDFVFNADDPAIRCKSARQEKYNDKRANPKGKLLDDLWSIPRVAGTHGERIKGFPTQLPLELCHRIVRCASNPGDLVLDCFSGSATSGVAAIKNGRRYLGIELNPEYAALSEERLKASPVWTSPMDIKQISLKLRDSAIASDTLKLAN
jgi:DNA modification methylase